MYQLYGTGWSLRLASEPDKEGPQLCVFGPEPAASVGHPGRRGSVETGGEAVSDVGRASSSVSYYADTPVSYFKPAEVEYEDAMYEWAWDDPSKQIRLPRSESALIASRAAIQQNMQLERKCRTAWWRLGGRVQHFYSVT